MSVTVKQVVQYIVMQICVIHSPALTKLITALWGMPLE